MDAPKQLVRNPPRTTHVSKVSEKNQTGEINSDTIKSLVASLKILGFEKMKCLCEHTFIRGVTEEYIRNLITQSGLEDKKVKIDWLFGLNSEGVKKILKIIEDLQSSRELIFGSCQEGSECTYSLFKENILGASCEIRLFQSALVLTEGLFTESTTTLLTAKEVLELFGEDLYLIDFMAVNRERRMEVFLLKVAQANNSDLRVSDESERLNFLGAVYRLSAQEIKKIQASLFR